MTKKANKRVVVVGSTNWDICMYLPKIPAPGETVGGGSLKGNLGGKGANQAVACHKAGADVTFVSAVGDDANGVTVIEQFTSLGLDCKALKHVEQCSTGTACIFIDEHGENCIGLTAGANAHLSPHDIQAHQDLIPNAP